MTIAHIVELCHPVRSYAVFVLVDGIGDGPAIPFATVGEAHHFCHQLADNRHLDAIHHNYQPRGE